MDTSRINGVLLHGKPVRVVEGTFRFVQYDMTTPINEGDLRVFFRFQEAGEDHEIAGNVNAIEAYQINTTPKPGAGTEGWDA